MKYAEQFERTLSGVDPRCRCAHVNDHLKYVLEDRPPPLCPIHDADEIEQQRVAADVAELEQRISPMREALERLTADAPLEGCTCVVASTAQLARLAMEGKLPPPCPHHDPQPGSSMALNGDPIEAFVRSKLGIPTTTTDPSLDDAP